MRAVAYNTAWFVSFFCPVEMKNASANISSWWMPFTALHHLWSKGGKRSMNQSRTSHVSNAYSIKRTLSINNANGDCVLDVKLLEHLLCNLYFFFLWSQILSICDKYFIWFLSHFSCRNAFHWLMELKTQPNYMHS